MRQLKAQYDLAIQPTDISAALDALDNVDNYGIYAQNLRDPEAIKKAFGPSVPAQKTRAAWNDWTERSDDTKGFKLNDIKKRAPEDFEKGMEQAKIGYEKWYAEGNEGEIEDYLYTLEGKELPKDIIGRYGKNYFPLKTPANLKKYAGRLEKDVHFDVKDDKIIFPIEKSPFKKKPYLQKVLKTIMDKSGLEYEIVDVEKTDEEGEVIKKPEKKVVSPLTFTSSDKNKVDRAKKIFRSTHGDIGKYEDSSFKDENGNIQYKITITGLTQYQRDNFFNTKRTIKEDLEFDLDLYLMQKRAGL